MEVWGSIKLTLARLQIPKLKKAARPIKDIHKLLKEEKNRHAKQDFRP
ncbi:hypothetical protein OZL92_09755 [Bacillus sonorensis]|nr:MULTISPECIES: hypothetical protein [Bacillus]TWK79400.1 hypothetical protein CHCC20335_0177 [Bacillus paralicheniformis]MCY7857450.1 hypothetical protein [Bacillus sonorensis]MCY8026531.1 hypothetical protein [Bacillus sonorensis]MCY8033673.1 hypothetical protein [Bacillus sonorensis]MCY8086271.1 hypothetical protein [Bacillus sonorensis]